MWRVLTVNNSLDIWCVRVSFPTKVPSKSLASLPKPEEEDKTFL